MKNNTIKILCIAPYQNLKNSMYAVAENFENIELTVFVGDLEAGAEIARQYMKDNFDVIISRGGTAKLIKEFSLIPVVEIPLTVYDILRTIRLAANSAKNSAIIGFPNITATAGMLCDLLNYNIEIVTIHNKNEALTAINVLKKKGIQFVLCDVLTEMLARENGLKPILITSGNESIKDAIENAVQICSYSSYLQQKNLVFEAALNNQAENTIILTAGGDIFFSNYVSENFTSILSYLKCIVNSSLNSSQKNASYNSFNENFSQKSFHTIDNTMYAITNKTVQYFDDTLYIFTVEGNKIPVESNKHGLTFSSYEVVLKSYNNSFYALTQSAKDYEKKTSLCSTTDRPIMIIGEYGTCKNKAAEKIYIDSPNNNNPFICIDCQLLNEKNWKFLTKHYNSPLFDTANTIFISNINALSNAKRQQLLSLIIDTNAHKRNKFIFSCSQTQTETNSNIFNKFVDYLSCITIYLQPLREQLKEIETCANLYLNNLNMSLSKQIIGFEPSALELMKSYDWHDNFHQLERVLSDLAVFTTSNIITKEMTAEVLNSQKHQYITSSIDTFDYDRTLNDMTTDIIKTVVTKCDGNQSKAAKQLGIGRTTLWRYISKEE